MSSDDKGEQIDRVEVLAPSAIESIERAQIDMQIATAKKYPRDLHKVKKGIESLATMDRETAEACFYSLPRGGKTIQGPGVRLAEIAVHEFGNVRVQTRVIDTVMDGRAPHVTVQAVCADLEKNVAVSIEKRRRIVGKKSKGGMIDEDDINLAVNACAAIAFRDAAFKVVPMALVKPAFEAAKKVAIGDAKTLADRRAEALARFAKMGIKEDRVLSVLGKATVDAVDLNDLESLFGIFTAIKDGATTIDDAFPVAKKETPGTAGLVDKLKGQTAKTEPATATPEPAKEPAADEDPAKAEKASKIKTLEGFASSKKIAFGKACQTLEIDLASWREQPLEKLDELFPAMMAAVGK